MDWDRLEAFGESSVEVDIGVVLLGVGHGREQLFSAVLEGKRNVGEQIKDTL